MSELTELLQELDALKKAVRAVTNKQIFSKHIRETLHEVAEHYFTSLRDNLPTGAEDIAMADQLFSQIHELSRKNPSRQKCLDTLTDARKVLVRLEGAVLVQGLDKSAGINTGTDDLILSTLDEVCPAAAGSYRQALKDLTEFERNSWRGSATELREALRETLDTLAPDKDVEAMTGYKPEPNAQRPTMKQKARFILRSRGMNSGQIATPVDAVKHVEESLGALTRSVYTRSSVSTHTPTTREEVTRIHVWVRIVMCELLALPHG